MAPTIPLDYTGHMESKRFSKTALGDIMGKTKKVSKGYSGFEPDYRHAVETVAESEGFGGSGRIDAELTALEDSCAPSKKCLSFNVDGYKGSVVPIRILSLSKLSALQRRGLEGRLKCELDLVKKFQRKIASYGVDNMVRSRTTDVHSYQNGPKRPAMVEGLPRSTNNMPMAAGKKKCPPGRNGHGTKGGAVAVRRNESVKQDLSQSASLGVLMKQCETLLSRLMSHQHGWIFNTPVDIAKHNIPDYFNVIKHPMDLGTLKSKLLSNQYASPVEFAADVRLTFKNAMTYNPPGHEVHVMAETLNKYFELRWKPIEKKIPPRADESTPSKSSVIEPDSAYVPPAKKQKTKMENKVNRQRDKQTMSDVEKQKLGAELEASLAGLPDNIINFLKESTLHGDQASEDEIEIDIDALSDDTLFKLRKLLDNYLLEENENQAILEPCEIETKNESGFSNSCVQLCIDDEAADEDVDIGGNDPPPTSSSASIMIDKNAARRNGNSSSSRSSNNTESGSSASERDSPRKSIPPASTMNESVNTGLEWKESELGEPNHGDILNGHAEPNSMSNGSFDCRQEGENAPPERQVSPEKQYRAALLRSRFADIIIKAQENTIEKGAEKLKLEREELQRRRREEKARLQAEAKAAEEARKKAEIEATAEAKRKRELEREAARQALRKMEKTVDINSHYMEDLEMFRSGPGEHLQSFMDEESPENSQNGLGGFKFQVSSNPLEQLGLYMKDDDDEEEEAEPQSNPETSDDPEEGEID